MLQIKINGLEEIESALLQLPEKISERYLRRATFKAAQVIEEDAITRAPVSTGALRDHIAIFKRTEPPYVAHYVIGMRNIRKTRKIRRLFRIVRRAGGKQLKVVGDTYYWRFLEFGTAKMPAKPFLRPAFETQKESAIEKFREILADGVQIAASEVVP